MTIPRRRGETVEEAQAALGIALDWLSTLQYLQREGGLSFDEALAEANRLFPKEDQ